MKQTNNNLKKLKELNKKVWAEVYAPMNELGRPTTYFIAFLSLLDLALISLILVLLGNSNFDILFLNSMLFLKDYSVAIILLGGLFVSFVALLGKTQIEESPTFYTGEENYLISGTFYLFRIFFLPLSNVVLLIVLLEIGMGISDIKEIDLVLVFDYLIFSLSIYLLQRIFSEIQEYNKRMNFYVEHQKYNKKTKVYTTSFVYTPTIVLLFLLEAASHVILGGLSLTSAIVIILNLMLTLFALLGAALLMGLTNQKPYVLIKTKTKKIHNGYFIRWEHNSVRIVPEFQASLVIPTSEIETISYPHQQNMTLKRKNIPE